MRRSISAAKWKGLSQPSNEKASLNRRMRRYISTVKWEFSVQLPYEKVSQPPSEKTIFSRFRNQSCPCLSFFFFFCLDLYLTWSPSGYISSLSFDRFDHYIWSHDSYCFAFDLVIVIASHLISLHYIQLSLINRIQAYLNYCIFFMSFIPCHVFEGIQSSS